MGNLLCSACGSMVPSFSFVGSRLAPPILRRDNANFGYGGERLVHTLSALVMLGTSELGLHTDSCCTLSVHVCRFFAVAVGEL